LIEMAKLDDLREAVIAAPEDDAPRLASADAAAATVSRPAPELYGRAPVLHLDLTGVKPARPRFSRRRTSTASSR